MFTYFWLEAFPWHSKVFIFHILYSTIWFWTDFLILGWTILSIVFFFNLFYTFIFLFFPTGERRLIKGKLMFYILQQHDMNILRYIVQIWEYWCLKFCVFLLYLSCVLKSLNIPFLLYATELYEIEALISMNLYEYFFFLITEIFVFVKLSVICATNEKRCTSNK